MLRSALPGTVSFLGVVGVFFHRGRTHAGFKYIRLNRSYSVRKNAKMGKIAVGALDQFGILAGFRVESKHAFSFIDAQLFSCFGV